MFSDHKVVGYCIITIFVVATPFRHRDLNIFFFLVPEDLLCCRIVIIAKLSIVAYPALFICPVHQGWEFALSLFALSLKIAYIKGRLWAIRSHLSLKKSDLESIAPVALVTKEWFAFFHERIALSLTKNDWFAGKTDKRISNPAVQCALTSKELPIIVRCFNNSPGKFFNFLSQHHKSIKR